MTDLVLPDGWEWLARTGDAIRCVHVETGKCTGIAGVVRAVTPDRDLQRELDYQIARKLHEARLDRLFEECGRDHAEFKRRRAELTA